MFKPSHHCYAFLAVLLWSTSYVLTKLVVDAYSPFPLAFLRIAVACVAMAAILLWRRTPPPPAREWPRFVLPGLLGFSLFYFLFNKGTTLANPTTVVIAIATSSIFTPVLARVVFRERLRALGWLAIGLAFAGILVMTLWNGAMDLNMGVVWCCGAALSLAVYNLLQRGLSRSYSALQINAYSFFASIVPMLVFLPGAAREVAAAAWWQTAIVVYMGVFPSAVAYLAYVKALAVAPRTSDAANYMFLTPLLTAVLEFGLMGRFPDAPTLAGGLMILGSLALFAYSGRRL